MNEEPTYEELLRQYKRVELENEEQRSRAKRRRRLLSTHTKVLISGVVLILMVSGVLAAFVFSQSMTGTVGAAPVVGPSTLSLGTPPPCTSSCTGILVGNPAVTFSVTTINGGFTSGTTNVPTIWLVPTSTSSCGLEPNPATPPTGWVGLPSGTGSPMTVSATSYNYCVYYATLTAGESLSITVAWSQ